MKPHDLEKMLKYYKLALETSRENDVARPMYLSDVGYALQHKFHRGISLQDLRDARHYFELAAQGQDLNNRVLHRNNIAHSLQNEFEFTRDRTVLEEAIVMQEDIVKSLQAEPPTLATSRFYRNLGTMYTGFAQAKDRSIHSYPAFVSSAYNCVWPFSKRILSCTCI